MLKKTRNITLSTLSKHQNVFVLSTVWLRVVCDSIFLFIPSGDPGSFGTEFIFSMPISFMRQGGTPYIYISTLSSQPCSASISVPDLDFSQEVQPTRAQGTQVNLPRLVFPTPGASSTPTIIVTSMCEVSVIGFAQTESRYVESFTVLPTKALGNDHIIVTYASSFDLPAFPSFYSITALADQTSIDIEISTGETLTILLQAYESYLYEDAGLGHDLTGTTIGSNSSVAVIAGVTCSTIPSNDGSCATIIQQIPPLLPSSKAPFEYILAPFLKRTSGYVYRIYGASDRAMVSISNEEFQSSFPLSRSQVYESSSNGTVFITSDKPVYVTQYMRSFDSDGTGGVSMVTVPPVASYSQNVSFYAFNSGDINLKSYINVIVNCEYISDLTLDNSISLTDWDTLSVYGENNFCVVRRKVKDGSHTIGTSNEDATFLVVVYGIPAKSEFSFLHLAGYNVGEGK